MSWGQPFSQIATNDPDGNGDLGSKILTPVWESSTNGPELEHDLHHKHYLLSRNLKDSWARVNYVDGDQFGEGIVSQTVVIPESPPEVVDDYEYRNQWLRGGQNVATGSLEVVGDRDWFRVDLEQEKLILFPRRGYSW